MARIALIMPRLPQSIGAPYLGQQFLGAELLANGHEVLGLDLASRRPPSPREFWELIDVFQPDAAALTLFTSSAKAGYALIGGLKARGIEVWAGGPHVTVRPQEPLRFGATVAVAGEGERAIVALADDQHWSGPGVWRAAGKGTPYQALEDLDSLAFPHRAIGAWKPRWYRSDAEPVITGGMMTSRGCPARCTFCSNYVTGRVYRHRSASVVVDEMSEIRSRYGTAHFAFFDDAFTASRPRLNALCDEMSRRLPGITWSCITPANMVKPKDLRRMRDAGCVSVNFGIESGDYNTLRTIEKGQRPAQVMAAVQAANALGMHTVVNFMFGFPGEDVEALRRTRGLMESLAPFTDTFNNRGVLVPFPGTSVYERHHREYGFTDWWLDAAYVAPEPEWAAMTAAESLRAQEVDPTLELDFFRYSDAVAAEIAECVRFKAQHNVERLNRWTAPTVVASVSTT